MAGSRTVAIRFTGDAKGLDRAAANAGRSMKKFQSNVESTVTNMASGLGDVFTAGLKSPAVATAIGTAGAFLAAILSSALGAGLVAGAGIAAIALPMAIGIKAAANDPAVKAAFGAFSTKGKEVLDEFGAAFKGPLIRAAETFGAALDKMRPIFMEISRIVAPIVDLLAPAFADMAVNSLPGVRDLIKSAAPFFEVIAKHAPSLGKAISEFLTKISEGGPGAQQFLEDVMNFLIWVIPKVGAALRWLSNYYVTWRGTLLAVIAAVRGAWNAFYKFFQGIGSRIGGVVGASINAFNNFRNRVTNVWHSITNTIASAVRRIEGWWNRLKSLASSAINFSIGGFNIPGISGGRAGGGPVAAGRSYLVGERGPEILTMGSSSGNVTPNHELGGEGGDLYLTLNLGEGIEQRLRIERRDLKRRTRAGAR